MYVSDMGLAESRDWLRYGELDICDYEDVEQHIAYLLSQGV